jgi:hypothetical protein
VLEFGFKDEGAEGNWLIYSFKPGGSPTLHRD